ncbi:prostacyclin receptor [Scomber scombrus]|uniref:Thromboxane A2 receptor n=1 Tax=Scomber scombrus TaxID=13677 RepID=A0AAV1NVB9_SCOSC|nr:prostacyclin receptor [Scomber scombrus]
MTSNELCNNVTCNDTLTVKGDGKPATSIIMFLAGVVGNLLALFILGVHQKEHRSRSSVFCILVTGLALTDLLGTCLLSPPVFICYARNMSLIGLGEARLCNLFGFAMSFFGLAPTLILCAMAVERCLAISHPYFYSVHIRRSFAKFTLFFIYLFSLAFCLLPYSGYGKFRQYSPGTWCFIDMDAIEDENANLVLAFSLSYSSLTALLILAVFVCNGSVIVSLCQMHQSQKMRRGSVGSGGRKRRLSLAWFGQGEEEMDHLVLLALITVIFVVCSLPLTIAGFINAIQPFRDDNENLTAFRFYALNPIVDPWVFIICRKSVLHHLRSLLSCRFSKGAVKTTAQCSLSLPLDNHIQNNPPDVIVPQTTTYSSLPQ